MPLTSNNSHTSVHHGITQQYIQNWVR